MGSWGVVWRSALATICLLAVLIIGAPWTAVSVLGLDVDLGSYLLWVVAVGLIAFVGGLFVGGGKTTLGRGTGIVLGTIAFYVPFGLWLGSSLSDTFA